MPDSAIGYLLTRRQLELQGQSYIELWLATAQGPVKLLSPPQQAICFIKRQDEAASSSALEAASIPFALKPLTLTTFDQEPVDALYFNSNRLFYQARDVLNARGIELFEADIRMADRYLMERFVCAGVEFAGQASNSSGFAHYSMAKIKPAVYHPALKVVSVDIECSDKGDLYSIGLASTDFNKVLMIGQPQPGPEFIQWVDNERELLKAFIQSVQHLDPDVFIGWNVVNFDFRLLLNKSRQLDVPLRLGRGNEPLFWRDAPGDSNQGYVSMPGRVVIDGIDALKTATYQFDSFSLQNVAHGLLGKSKLSDDVDNRLAEIMHDFQHNKVKLAEYNLQDCQLVLEIFDHTKLLDFLLLRSQLTGLELDKTGGSVAAFVNLYLPRLHRAGYISPNRPVDGGLASPGGYVMNSRPGLYRNVLVLDFKSLYPSIIRTFKIDPLGLVEGLRDPANAIEGYKGAKFSREKHFLPDIITSLWQQRDEAKRQKDQARSQAIKILMNSFYGVLGSGGCPFYDTRLASSITMRGHDIMQTTAHWIEQDGYQVIYGDTDSTFVWIEGDHSDDEVKAIGKVLQDKINTRWQEKIAAEHQLQSCLEIEFETHFSQFLMPTIRGSEQGSKKRYAGLIKSAEGEHLVFKGLENVRSDWTPLAKGFQHELYRRAFAGEDVSTYIQTVIAETKSGRIDDQLVYTKRLRRRLDKYVKNVPPHVKAARLADEKNKTLNKPLRYQSKGSVSYVMTVNGPEPLEYRVSAIDYQHYIDRQIQPIAEGILPFLGLSAESLTSQQMGLF